MRISDRTFLGSLAFLVLAVIASTAYHFLIVRDYEFIVEAPCDSATDLCYSRDCSTGECPPNNLEEYRVFAVAASMFSTCADESCLHECLSGSIACEEWPCGDSEEDECTGVGIDE